MRAMAAGMGARWGFIANSSSCCPRVHADAVVSSFLANPRNHVSALQRNGAAPNSTSPLKPAGAAGATSVVAGYPFVVASSSQHSNARIEKSNRWSRYGDPLATTDCDDNELCEAALSADIHFVEMENLEQEVSGRKTYRKVKKITKPGAKRLEIAASPKVAILKRGSIPLVEQLVKSDVPNHGLIKSRAAGMKIKSATALKLKVPREPAAEKFLTMKDWEEQAYQIIRRQKLRDAGLVDTKAKISRQSQKGPVETSACETLATSAKNANLQHIANLKMREGASMDDSDFGRIANLLSLEEKCRPLVEYLCSLGLREGHFVRIMDRHKACFQAKVDVVKERVEFLLSVGVQFEHLTKLIVRHPQILEYRVEQAMRPRVLYLKSLGMDEAKIGKIITVSPTLLECSLERSIKPRVKYMIKTVGIKSEDISKIVMRSPQILTQSIEGSLEPRVDFFLNEVKIPKEVFAKMVTKHPQLLHYSVEDSIRPHIKYLRSIGMNDDDILKVLSRLTQILSLSIKNCLQPKYEYLVKQLKGNVQTVISFPAYFSLSLEQRIIPRHRYVAELGKTPEGPFPMRLLSISDIAFCKWSKSSVDEYNSFRHDLLLSTFPRKFELKNNVHI